MRLNNKVVVVTGAASGIGLAVARLFAAEGARLVVGDIHDQRLTSLLSSLQTAGAAVVGRTGNIAERAFAEGLVDRAVEEFGRLDVLCNVAGIMDQIQGVAEVTDEVWRRVLAVNLDGPMFTMRRAVGRMMANGGGAIVNIASIASLRGGAAGAAYTASKHALAGLTLQTAHRYAKQGIRCNAICPGVVATNIAESMGAQPDPIGLEQTTAFAALTPGLLQPADIAPLVLFLACDASAKINGAIIPADGGWIA